MAQDSDKQTDQGQSGKSEGKSEQSTESKTSSKSGQGTKAGQHPEQQPGGAQSSGSKESANSLLQVLDFLRNSNLINLDMPLKSLFDQVQNIQADPSSEWGLIGDSGHWALVWQKKE